MTLPRDQVMDKVVALTKRRGFIYPSSEIHFPLPAGERVRVRGEKSE